MKNVRKSISAGAFIAAGMLTVAGPAQAQIYFRSPDFSGGPVSGTEPGIMLPLPGAKPEEIRAGMIWSLRAALNVAALQCQFEPTLLTLNQYNHLIANRSGEFSRAYSTLNAYFKRNNKTAKAAQTAIDQYGTRVYSGFSTVQAQRGFCLAAARVGRAALFAPKDGMGDLAAQRMRELRNSLIPMGDQQFPRFIAPAQWTTLVSLDDRCWDRKGAIKKSCRGG